MPVTTQPAHTPSQPPDTSQQPLILTLSLSPQTTSLLTHLRTKYFPTQRNHLSAHITLFHAIPAPSLATLSRIVSSACSATAPFTLGIKSPFMLGRKGVALGISSWKLRTLHEQILCELERDGVQLTEQDMRLGRAHVTVQNKVGQEVAKRTLAALKQEWEECAGRAEGLGLWRYEVGGTWTHLQEFAFTGRS
ncbi:unnamed protein product [Diplocarpon coronariae]|uniref:Uncharacterized protein n=1 Tax=Diplocarpon coronariae TaxID=2795749 RepID=A0A218ZHQ5_9HELO|nr:hypothetical protein B2J93_5175 [Marssonina coronariae]